MSRARSYEQESEEVPVTSKDWTTYSELEQFHFNELMESYTRIKDEIEFREQRKQEISQELQSILAVNDLANNGVVWEGRSVKVVDRRGASKISPEKLIEHGVAASVIAASTVEGAPYTYLDVRKLGKKKGKQGEAIS